MAGRGGTVDPEHAARVLDRREGRKVQLSGTDIDTERQRRQSGDGGGGDAALGADERDSDSEGLLDGVHLGCLLYGESPRALLGGVHHQIRPRGQAQAVGSASAAKLRQGGRGAGGRGALAPKSKEPPPEWATGLDCSQSAEVA